MKRCTSCGQILAQRITTCPACGSALVAGITSIDDYRVEKIIHEGRSSLVFRAIKAGHKKPVTIRLFTDQSGVDESVAQRLDNELKILAKLPPDLFVQHFAIRQSKTGHWYRVSEWVDADNWGSIFVSGLLNDQRRMVSLFHNIASALELLHAQDHFMPYLILDDILLPRNQTRSLAVKINYKLSRFLNARATHHGPMLQKLLECHPDIINQRAIDFRTSIWSLGKIFVELLTADHNMTRFSSRVDDIKDLHPDLAVLIKVMLSEDPDLRPQSMSTVVQTLERILETIPSAPVHKLQENRPPATTRELTWFRRVVVLLLVVILGIVAVNTFVRVFKPPDTQEGGFTKIIESHTRSIGFLMVEYWLSHKEQIIYRNKVEGTAFLVDEDGYLLTNRHVACPWLEDISLFQIKAKLSDKEIDFGHRMFLWFEGAKAFNRFQGFDQSSDLADAYYLSGAFRSDGESNLRVVGVPRGIREPGRMLHQTFKNDFAVLKVDTLPGDVMPLPLADLQSTGTIKRLSPVVIMGFPLGSRTQDERINASITRGHVRRTSKELIQVDSSIYKGNSGGPAVNSQGRVIGIASGVITDQPMDRIPLQTPLSDFGLVLPIAEPANFVESLKAGQSKWNGTLDFSLEKKLKQVMQLAADQDFEGAAQLADNLLKTSQDPALLFTAALLDFCTNDMATARERFTRLISIEGENTESRLMLYIIDWLEKENQSRELTRELFAMEWDDADEFSGYLAQVLESETLMSPNFIDYENRYEKGWRTFINALILEKHNRLAKAMDNYKEVVMTSGANDHLYFISFSRLNRLLDQKAAFAEDKSEHQANKKELWTRAGEQRAAAKEIYQNAVVLIQALESGKGSRDQKMQAFDALLDLSPGNKTIMGRAAFFHAEDSEWDKAVSFIDRHFERPVRETALGLSLGLLKGQSLKLSGKSKQSRAYLNEFQAHTKNPWYGIVIKHLLDKPREKDLVKLAANNPAKLVVLHTALGLDAEGNKDRKSAEYHYREALGTYMESWNEYDLARARLLRFRKTN
ncbi:MAG: trypsin-like peptidase domain-containing protein [Desulfobacterales bacterium]|nr:trypsin-like peptidase domain-containing protein [Desulfobacterales bacterium]